MAGYRLGIDLGTTWTAAAVVVGGSPATVVSLSQRSPAIPSVVHIGANGTVLVGDAAERRGLEEPERIAREMKRRVGDPTPILLGGSPWAAELLQARVLRAVVDQVAAEQGGPADSICVTHPANWGAFKLDLLTQAIRQVGVAAVDLLPEPVAAATWYASGHRLDDGAAIAVYDLGGGTFDTAVVRRSGAGFELLGRPDGVERFGGIDIDAAVLAHVAAELGDAWTGLDHADPEARADGAEFRQRCVEAKEALSVDTAASIPVRLPGVRTTVRLTRDELEAMVRAPLGETIVALRRTITSAGLTPADLAAVLLVGGSSRMPLVAHLVSGELGVPVAVDANPKFAVALGAALAPAVAPVVAAPTPPVEPPPPVDPPAMPAPAPLPSGRRRGWLVPAGIAAVLALVVAVVLAIRGGGDGDGGEEAGTTDSTTTTEPTDGVAGNDDGSGDDGLRIGLLLPYGSEELAFVAPAMRLAAELAVQDINEATSVLGSAVELVEVDSGPDSGEGLDAAFATFTEAGVDLVVGPVDTVMLQAARDRVVDEGLTGCAAHDVFGASLFDDDSRYIRTIPSQFLLATALTTVVVDDGHRSVAIVAPADTAHLRDSLISELEDAGVSIDLDLEYERNDLDAAAMVSDLTGSDASAIVLVGDPALAEIVVQGQSAGLRGPFYGDDTFEAPEIGSLVAPAILDGAAVTAVAVDAAPGVDEPGSVASRVQDALEEAGEDSFPYAAPYIYDCIVLAAVAAEAAGSSDADALASTLIDTSGAGVSCELLECLAPARDGEDIDWEGASGSVDLDDDGEVTSGYFAVGRWGPDEEIVYEDGVVVEP